MIVVADSSPLNYLVLIDEIPLLPALFGQVLVPEAVFRELQSLGTPVKVAAWISGNPDWLAVRKPAALHEEAGLEKFGAGEREAIALSLENDPDVTLLIDEEKGRKEANRRQIRAIGTLGILDLAAARGFIDLPNVIERLVQTNFHLKPNL